jgi:hypothetical protein
MKTIKKYLILVVLLAGVFASSCSDYLDTNPTDQVSGTTIFQDANAAKTAINGIYYLLWRPVYVSSNGTQGYGHESTLLAQDLMGDDAVQLIFNWYGWDYDLSYTRTINIGTGSRNYGVWNMDYTLISNLNYIIASEGKIGGDLDLAKNVVAQAYALRAFSYFDLIQGFQFTYLGHENAPGVPIYTEPVRAGSEGKPRGTVQDVYTQINSDLKHAIDLFTELGKPVQEHCSFIDYFVAKGLEARIALVQGRWADAYAAATEARSRRGIRLLQGNEILTGLSNKSLASNLWTMEMIPDQSQIYGSIYCHLDPQTSTAYGAAQRKCISKWLYDKIASPAYADNRTNWFKDGSYAANVTTGVNVNYGQMKRLAREQANWVGEIIFMRAEEMLLIQAEAKARLGEYDAARTLLKELTAVRLTTAAGRTAYETYLTGLANATNLPTLTNTDPTNILEEVLLQRRIELWGEVGRIKDILRLKQGYTRNYAGSNHVELLTSFNTGAESGAFLFKIPQAEFDGNPNITSDEQNPIN